MNYIPSGHRQFLIDQEIHPLEKFLRKPLWCGRFIQWMNFQDALPGMVGAQCVFYVVVTTSIKRLTGSYILGHGESARIYPLDKNTSMDKFASSHISNRSKQPAFPPVEIKSRVAQVARNLGRPSRQEAASRSMICHETVP
ncbi:MAG: hypothetical protein COA78_20685 [Blastopirellula sp.]|nr:MAG: hypothetical protein COA78_20685 [Blastopirellula sp.]